MPNGQQLNIRVDLDRALRDPRENIRVLAGDFIILQERPGDAVLRYMYQTFRLNTTVQTINQGSLTQSLNAVTP